MSYFARASVVVMLLTGLVPGIAEASMDLAHYLIHGDSVHSEEQEHQPLSSEHGCGGTFHVCSCHSTPGFVLTASSSGTFFGNVFDCAEDSLLELLAGYHAAIPRPPKV